MLNLLPQNVIWSNCVCGALKQNWESFQGSSIYLVQPWSITESVYLLYGYNVCADGTEGKAVVIRCYWNPEGTVSPYSTEWSTAYTALRVDNTILQATSNKTPLMS